MTMTTLVGGMRLSSFDLDVATKESLFDKDAHHSVTIRIPPTLPTSTTQSQGQGSTTAQEKFRFPTIAWRHRWKDRVSALLQHHRFFWFDAERLQGICQLRFDRKHFGRRMPRAPSWRKKYPEYQFLL